MINFLIEHYGYNVNYRNVYNRTLNFYNAQSFINGIDYKINNQDW